MKVPLFHSFDFEAMIPLTFMPTVVLRINTTALSWSVDPLCHANIAETLLVPLITEQGGKEIQHEEHEDILFGPSRRAQ